LILRFGKFELDDQLFELRRESELRPLPSKGFDMLRYLLLNAQRVVTKEELFAELWSGEHVSESVLPVNVRTIRRALDEAESEGMLKTVRGRGYRMVCTVERLEAASPVLAAPPESSTLVGRDAIMAGLRQDYKRAADGDGRSVLLYGESGIGKTRILDEFAQDCRSRGALVVQVRCPGDPGAPPLWPVFELLRAGESVLKSSRFAADVERSGFDIERAASSVRQFSQRGLKQRMDAAAARFGLIQTLMRLLDRASRIAPIVIVMDDLHFIDEGTAGLCEAIVRSLSGMRVLTLAAYRDSELRRGTLLAGVMGSISSQPGLRQLRISGLDRAGVGEFVRAETGVEPSADLLDALLERTAGNPFFLRETLRLLSSEGMVESGGAVALARLGIAPGIKETVIRRIDKLGPDCNSVLEWASVVGRRFSVPMLLQLCGMSSTKLLQVLAAAEEAHIIVTSTEPDEEQKLHLGEYAFAHGLIREILYEAMSGPERVLRHRAVAEAIERFHADAIRDHVFELARHFFEAAPGGDVDRAVEYTLRAARRAQGRHANDDAVLHFDQAVRAEQLRVPRDELRYCCVLLGRADALWRASRYTHAQQEFQHAASLARHLGRYDLLSYAVFGMVGWPRFNQLSFGVNRLSRELSPVSSLAREALEGLGDSDPSLSARLHAVLVRTSEGRGDSSDLALAEDALRLADRSGDDRARFHALLAKQSVLPLPERRETALSLASEALEIARRLPGRTRLFAAYEARIPLLLMIGDMETADEDIAASLEIAEHLRSPAHRYASRRFELARAVGDGAAARARELAASVVQLGRLVEDGGASRATQQLLFWMSAVGVKKESLEHLHGLLDQSLRENPDGSALAAYFYMLVEDEGGCAQSFSHLARLGFGSLRRDVNWLWQLCACADVAAFLQDREQAQILFELIEPHARVNVMNRLYCYRGAAATPLARLAHLLGRYEEAVHWLDEAIEFNRQIGAEPSRVWAQCVLATVLREGSPGDRERARQLVRSVQREAGGVGLARVVQRHWDQAGVLYA